MALSPSPSTGSYQPEDRSVNKSRARRLLARMDRLEEHAQKSLGELPLGHEATVESDIVQFQRIYQNTYLRLVGVEPSQRDTLRQQLELTERTGDQSIDAITANVRSSIAQQQIIESPAWDT